MEIGTPFGIFSDDDDEREPGKVERIWNNEEQRYEVVVWMNIPYPDSEDGSRLRPGNVYDPDEWTEFLELHQIDINDVFEIEFQEDGRFTVYQYRRVDGQAIRDWKDPTLAATMEPVTLTPKAPFPAWS